MEGEPDRGEDGDSPEGATSALEDYREKLKKRYPDSGDHDQGEARYDEGDATEQHDSASTTKVADEAPKAGRRLEHADSSPDAEGRSEPDARLRSDSSDDSKARAAEHPEYSAELEGQNELERLREDFRQKYPEWEAGHGIKPEELKESRAAAESENLGRGAKRATPGEAENQDRGVQTEAGRSEMGRESDSSSESYAGEDARPELERLRKEINEKEEGLGDTGEVTPREEDSVSASSLEKDSEDKERAKTVVSGPEIRDSGGKIDSAQTGSESGVRSERSAREANFDVHEQGSPANANGPRALEGSAANKIPDSRSGTEGKEIGKTSDEEHANRKEIKAAAGDSRRDSRTIGGQIPLSKEAGTRLDKSSKSGKELADLEKIGASNKEQVNSRGKESQAPRSPRASYSESSRQEKLDRVDAIPVRAQLRNSNPVVIRLDIPKRAIEEKTGVKMEEEKLYHIKGSVVGKYDFEMYRTASSYIRHSVPVEHHHQIQPGEVHDISIASVKEVPLTKAQSKLVSEWRDRGVPWNRIAYRINHMKPEASERQIQPAQHSGASEKKKLHQLEKLERVDNIGATFVAVSRLQKGDLANPRDRFYFRIDNSEFKRKTGVSIEEGATYKIGGEIEGVGQFEKKLRSVAAGQDMPIYVPHELKDKVELGKEYRITINSVERIPSVRDSWEKLERPSMAWTWKEIASWIDTEGRINSKSGFYADIAQKDKRIIQEICGFYEEHGLHPNMTLQKGTGCYHAHLAKVEDVAKVVKNIEPYIRTENKKEQIQQFKDQLSAPRKTLQSGIREARKTLSLE